MTYHSMANTASCLGAAEYEIDKIICLILLIESPFRGSSPFSTAIYLLPNIQIMANEQTPTEIFAKIKETIEAQKAEVAKKFVEIKDLLSKPKEENKQN